MPEEDWQQRVAAVYRIDRRRIFATLVRLLGNFDLAEEALHDAFAAALLQWPVRGMPETPWTWLVSAGRFRTIDRLRKRARFSAIEGELARQLEADAVIEEPEPTALTDDTLRLIFTCCHPELPPDAQVALTLREVCGLTTEQIAAAYLTSPSTVAQRIVRAKARIRDAALPYAVPGRAELPDRLEAVLRVVYLIFNGGYAAEPSAAELAVEAIRLGRLLVELLPDPEALGLLSLMLLQHSRRAARLTPNGDIVLLPDQNRELWDRCEIGEGLALLSRAYAQREIGGYVLQAAIAAEHARPPIAADTNWGCIVELYDLLLMADPSPVAELNRAVAIGMRDGPAAALQLFDALIATDRLASYHLAYAGRADLLQKLNRPTESQADYSRALRLSTSAAEQRFLRKRIAELAQGAASSAEISSTSEA
jgi:RNA polymerase sigma-70 factor (ECF subfamily)